MSTSPAKPVKPQRPSKPLKPLPRVKPDVKAPKWSDGPSRIDPLADVPDTGDVEADSLVELETALDAMEAQDGTKAKYQEQDQNARRQFAMLYDADYWFSVCFKRRRHKDQFLAAVNAARVKDLPDKYLDGYLLAQLLNLDIEWEE